MFRVIISPILRSTRLCLQFVAKCTIDAADWWHEWCGNVPQSHLIHVTSRQQFWCIIPEDGRNYRPKHVELIEITNKLLMLHIVGSLYYYPSNLVYCFFLYVTSINSDRKHAQLQSSLIFHEPHWIFRVLLQTNIICLKYFWSGILCSICNMSFMYYVLNNGATKFIFYVTAF